MEPCDRAVERGCYRQPVEQPGPGAGPERADEERPELDELSEEAIVCRRCGAPVTSRRLAIEVAGRHAHTCFNPAGLLFEIGCFARAPGCAVSGRPTTEFCWFAGFAWLYAHCTGCGVHLGWRFVALEGQDAFFGLVLNRLADAG